MTDIGQNSFNQLGYPYYQGQSGFGKNQAALNLSNVPGFENVKNLSQNIGQNLEQNPNMNPLEDNIVGKVIDTNQDQDGFKKTLPYMIPGALATVAIGLGVQTVAGSGKYEKSPIKQVVTKIDNIGQIRAPKAVTGLLKRVEKWKPVKDLDTMYKINPKSSFVQGAIETDAQHLFGRLAGEAKYILGLENESSKVVEVESLLNGVKKETIHLKDALSKVSGMVAGKETSHFVNLNNQAKLGIEASEGGIKTFLGRSVVNAQKLMARTFYVDPLRMAQRQNALMTVIMILVNGYFAGETIKKTKDAPKGERLSTAMENIASDWLPFFLLIAPLGRFMYHKMASLRHYGVDPDLVKDAYKGLEEFNNKVKLSQQFTRPLEKLSKMKKGESLPDNTLKFLAKELKQPASTLKSKSPFELQALIQGHLAKNNLFDPTADLGKKAFKDGAKDIKKALNVKGSNWWHKPFNALGWLVDFGRQQVAQVTKSGKTLNIARGGSGVIIRLGVFLFVLTPILANILKKVSYAIFDKPTKTVEEEKKAKAEKEAKKQKKQKTPVSTNTPQSKNGQTEAGITMANLLNSIHPTQGNNGTNINLPVKTPVKLTPSEAFAMIQKGNN